MLGFVLVLGLALAKQYPTGRIVGGREVSPRFKYPWMTALLYYDEPMCGGTVFNTHSVITAAHCEFGQLGEWLAKFHRHDLDLADHQEGGSESRILARYSHPSYNRNGATEYDVAVWKVSRAPAVSLPLDNGFYTAKATLLTVIGWGDTRRTGAPSSCLLEVSLPVFDLGKCRRAYPDLHTTSQFCVGLPEGGKDACQGDSGGPVIKATASGYTLVGVVSWGIGCADAGKPGVYTRIHQVRDFIYSRSS